MRWGLFLCLFWPHQESFGEENPLAEKNILEQKLFWHLTGGLSLT
jgi:hypothetical protein